MWLPILASLSNLAPRLALKLARLVKTPNIMVSWLKERNRTRARFVRPVGDVPRNGEGLLWEGFQQTLLNPELPVPTINVINV
jgi:hypothetical protein